MYDVLLDKAGQKEAVQFLADLVPLISRKPTEIPSAHPADAIVEPSVAVPEIEAIEAAAVTSCRAIVITSGNESRESRISPSPLDPDASDDDEDDEFDDDLENKDHVNWSRMIPVEVES
jgi:hypothetical protein